MKMSSSFVCRTWLFIVVSAIEVHAIDDISNFRAWALTTRVLSTPASCQDTFTPIRINCGGRYGDFTDSAGKVWVNDTYFDSGFSENRYGLPIDGTEDDYLYQSERTGDNTVSYKIPVPNSTYKVSLYFAEIYWTEAQKRLMDISIEGTLLEHNYDVFSEAGGKAIKHVEVYQITVTDGQLNIDFTALLDRMKVSAIEVECGGHTDPTTCDDSCKAIRINCGGRYGDFTDSAGKVWVNDIYFDSGFSENRYGLAIAGTEDDYLYQSERTGDNTVSYKIPVSNCNYTVSLHYAEIYWTEASKRLMDISIEGKIVEHDYDVFSEAGGKAVKHVEMYEVSITDGILDIAFTTLLDRMKISAIEVQCGHDIIPKDVCAFAFETIRINCGGRYGPFTDSAGQVWVNDIYFEGGFSENRYGLPIAGTEDDYLYQSERTGDNTVSYKIPVPNCTYEVSLHFAEIYWTTAGKRLMDISVEGEIVEHNYDVFAVAGGKATMHVEHYEVTVTDGELNIDFTTLLDRMKVSAIEIRTIYKAC